MSTPCFYRLNSVSVVDIVGKDAEKIIHNLTTNEIKSLGVGIGCESFITDVKGKTLGHVLVYRRDDHLRLIGAGGQSEQIAAHADRYTIVEDAEPRIRDADYVAFVVAPDSVDVLSIEDQGGQLCEVGLDALASVAYGVRWLGSGTVVLLSPDQAAEQTEQKLTAAGLLMRGEDDFQLRRTIEGFPWYGVDFDEKNLPQEVDRNDAALSFTKGCYLGQETVARLDAMGQVQKKLVRWTIAGGVPEAGTELVANEKTVARLTSVAQTNENEVVAIGMTRRSHFDAGQQAVGKTSGGDEIAATVLS